MAVKAGCPASTKTPANTQKYSAAPAMTIDTSKTYTATVVTTTGTFTITLDAKAAPTTVNNFVFLAQKGFYHCVIFHRVIPQFMDQTGDPTGTGQGGPGYTIPDENPPKAANPARPVPARVGGHGQHRRPQLGWQPVLHRRRAPGREPAELLRALRIGDLGHERGRYHQPAGLGPAASRPT